jgi:hypothetical protein
VPNVDSQIRELACDESLAHQVVLREGNALCSLSYLVMQSWKRCGDPCHDPGLHKNSKTPHFQGLQWVMSREEIQNTAFGEQLYSVAANFRNPALDELPCTVGKHTRCQAAPVSVTTILPPLRGPRCVGGSGRSNPRTVSKKRSLHKEFVRVSGESKASTGRNTLESGSGPRPRELIALRKTGGPARLRRPMVRNYCTRR